MKKTLLKSVMAVLVALFSLNANAYDALINGIYYNLSFGNRTAQVTNGNFTSSDDFQSQNTYKGHVVIPSSISYGGTVFSVTSIDEYAFVYHKIIGGGSVTAPNNSMTSLTIPNSVKKIGPFAFYYCRALTSVTIPNSVISIGDQAFAYCNGLTTLTIPNSVTSIGTQAFSNCSGLTSITIPNGVTSIGDQAFYGCSGLTSVTIPYSVTSIGGSAFRRCSNLTSVIIPNSVTNINGGTFADCSNLTSVIIPNSVTSIGGSAFCRCSNLTSITIPNGVTCIEDGTFDGCSALTSVTIPNSVKSIGWSAFKNCSSLTSVTIPNSVTSIGSDAFYGCNGLTAVHITDLVAWSMMELPGNPLKLAHHLFLNGKEVKDLVIPNGVTSIGVGAFMGCSSLTSVTIPNSVTSIGHYAFDGCSGLTSVTIPNSVKFIGNNAFRDCSELTAIHISDLTAWCEMSQGSSFIPPLSYAHHLFLNGEEVKELVIPDNVTNISSLAFKGCSGLTSVTIPENVTSIGPYAFEGCSGLTSVILKIEEPFALSLYAFDDIASTCTLTVPYGTKDAYIAKGWTEDVFKGGIIEASNLTSNNYLSIEDAEVCKGKNLVLPVNMSNTESITALQFEMTLPTGVSLSACQLTDRKGEDHTTSYKKLVNGNYQVTVFSASKAVFSGTDGAVLNLMLDVDEDIDEGDYPISLTNIELTTVATKAINPADVSATLTVSDVKIGDTDGNGKVSITDAVAIVSHILGDDIDGFVAAAADVDGNGRITITDAVAVVDMILSGTASAKMRVNVEEDVLDPQ